MREVSFSHLTLDSKAALVVEWKAKLENGEISDLPETMIDWNYYSEIEIGCVVTADLAEILSEVGLVSGQEIAVVITAKSTATPSVHQSLPKSLVDGNQYVSLSLLGEDLGGSLTVELVLALAKVNRSPASPLSPTKVGSVLASESRRILLEGAAPRLPIMPVSFTAMGIPNGQYGFWWLKLLSRDLYSSAASSVWLWMNSENPRVSKMLANADSPRGSEDIGFLRFDFLRQLLIFALGHEEFDVQHDYPDGSLGALLSGIVLVVGDSMQEVRSLYDDDPGYIEVLLQSSLGE